MTLSACNPTNNPAVNIIEQPRPELVVQEPDVLNLRPVQWVVVTPENIEQVFNSLPEGTALFALTSDGYTNLSLNISDTRALIEQQQAIIIAYENYY